MHGHASGSMLLVNAGVDSMGGVIDGGVEISSAPSPQLSSDLEKTQAELRETFSAAENFRRELEFLQKGGDPLDLKIGNAASVSVQSTSLTDQHPEQLTSEVKGSFAITASPHGDSVESSGRLGAPSVGEPNSADNLMLFDGDNKSVALEHPKKSYKRRIRSRPNRDGARSSSTDAGQRSGQTFFPSRHASRDAKNLAHDTDNQEHKYLSNSNSNSNPKSPMTHKTLAADVKLNGTQTLKSFSGQSYGPVDQPLTSDTRETPLSICPVGHVDQDTQTICKSGEPLDKKGFDSKSSCNNENEMQASINVNSNGTMELNLASKEAPSMEGSDVNSIKDDKISNIANDDSNHCPPSHNENGAALNKEEHNVCSQNTLNLETKEHQDSILEEARIIEEKRKRIAGLSLGILSSESNHRSHWHFVLEEMSWLANDFAQERLWKANAAAQISRRAAYCSWVRIQQQNSLWKQREVAHTLAEAVMEFWHTLQVKCHELELEGSKKDTIIGLHQYGMRFLDFNKSGAQYSSAQAPMTPDRITDFGSIGISWEDNLTEENLFYTVPPGAIEAYRKSIESHLLQCERTGSSVQEEMDVSGYDAIADDILEEDEGETSTYYLPGALEGSRLSKTAQKKRKHFNSSSHGPRSYETGADMSFMQTIEGNTVTQPSVISGKRLASSINVSIPTKRVRTASRPRFSGTSGFIQAPMRPTDASSGDTNSFQDEQSSLRGGSQIPNNMEAESVEDYEKQLQFDPTEVSNRPKKKKRAKHPGSTFDHRWQLDSNFQTDQKDHLKRRLDARQFDSAGNSVASQTSNMSNPNKFMKLLVRDRGRKAKSLKTPVGPQGSGSAWSLFEDQALVVLVHDMGANWELISDAINSTLQLKCISRNSKECKERHKILMDRNTGDGADSAEDSGSSQPYPSTLPGIPEGSARQLFQRLQGPMEEKTLKSHFEKIIMIQQKQHYRKAQNDNQDPKQLQQPHGSHALALSQVCANNLNGGPVLTPLDLCDANSSTPDFVPVGYQGPHSGGLPIQNHGNVAPMVPGSSSGSTQPGSSTVVLGSHLASASAPLSPSVREGRYGIPRAGSLSLEEQHRMQQYNQMSARNMQQSSLTHSGTDRGGVRMLPGVMNRNMTMARPPFQGLTSPSMLNSGGTPANMHSGPASGPGQVNSVRPREPLHMMRPSQNFDHQRPIMAPDLQMQQMSQGGPTQGVPPFASGMGSFPNIPPQQSPHMPNNNSHPHHPAYGMRVMKERQLHQQRLLQQQLASSNPVMPHVHPQQSQLPVSSPQSSTQIQSHTSSPIGTPSINQQKLPVPPPHGLVRNPQTGSNHRRPPPMKGGGRGIINQNIPANPSLLNGFSGGQSSLNQSQQKRYPGQPQAALTSRSSDATSNNHAQRHLKLVSQSQIQSQRMVQNRKDNEKLSESINDSSGGMSDNATTQACKVTTGGASSPKSKSVATGSENYGPGVNRGVVHKQSESDSLTNSVGRDAGVQWQQQQQQKQPSS